MNTFDPWKVLHLELREGIPSLPLLPDVQGFYTVFWWHGIPLGHQKIPVSQLPMAPTQLTELVLRAITPAIGDYLLDYGFKGPISIASKNPSWNEPPDFNALMALRRPLEKLRKRLSLSKPDHLTAPISIVICTRNRPEQLKRCLGSLQTLSQRPHEILVIDNAPNSDTTRELVTESAGIRYALEPRRGLDVARNRGISLSTGEIIAFIDDDVIFHPDWLVRIQQGFHDPKVMAVAGLVLPAELETEAQLIFETYWSFNKKYRAKTFDTQFFERTRKWCPPVWEIGAGTNMAFRREIFDQVGGFDERLDVGASGCSGDSEMWYRILAKGWTCYYEPAAVVYHYHRRDLEALKRQIHTYMRGHVVGLLIQFEKHHHWGNLRRLFFTLPKMYLKLICITLLKGLRLRHRTLWTEIAGCLSGVKFFLLNRQAPNRYFIESDMREICAAEDSYDISHAKI